MGHTWEVQAWGLHDGDMKYSYRCMYSGESLIKAVIAMIKAKRQGKFGCIALYWRG